MNKFNDKGEKHGPWEVYWDNGNLDYKGNYINGKKHGLFEDYWYDGILMYKTNYINGKKHGLCENYLNNGKINKIEYFL